MPYSKKACRYFETDTAKAKGVPATLKSECHEQYRGQPGGFTPRRPSMRALHASATSTARSKP
jgi:hypothetical protein